MFGYLVKGTKSDKHVLYYEKENVLLVYVSYEGSKACTLYTSKVLFKKPREQLQTCERVDNYSCYALPFDPFHILKLFRTRSNINISV